MPKRTSTPYHNDTSNLGLEFQRIAGGNLTHEPLWCARRLFIGDEYYVTNTSNKVNVEQFEANMANFFQKQGFILADKQLSVSGKSRGGALNYTHPSTPCAFYKVSFDIKKNVKLHR